jgi:hypothetical protein
MFLPHRWRVVRAGLSENIHRETSPIGPKQDAICKHRHLIQDLTLLNKISGYAKFYYPNLRRLVIDNDGHSNEGDRFFMDLTTKAPMLVDLKLVCVKTPLRFWDTLSKHPHLRNLCLKHIPFKVDGLPGFWRTCMNLERFEMHHAKMEAGCRPWNVVFDRLRHLKLGATNLLEDTYLLDLMIQSPRLESLDLMIWGSVAIKEQPLIGDWPYLKKLYIGGSTEDAHLAFIFKRVREGAGNIVDVEPYLSGLDTQARVFGSHFSSFVDVDLLYGVTTSVSTIPDIMCLCPRLERLRGRNALARSVAERGPWVCQQLRELRIQFLFDASGSEQDLKQLMFEQLSTLIRLERLTLDYDHYFRDPRYGALEVRLDCGLGKLASLQQMNYLRLHTTSHGGPSPNLGMGEVEWILENWKKLEVVKGDLNASMIVTAQLQSVFRSHGIRVK